MEREEKKDVDVLDLLSALYGGKRLIVGGTLAICVLAGALSFMVPEEFEATLQILPPKEQKQGFGFSDLLSALPIPTLRLGEKGTPADIFVATLKSQATRREMVEKFGLMERYGAETMTDAIEILAEKTTVDKTEDGTILIAVLDTDPPTAARINGVVPLSDLLSTWAPFCRTNATTSLSPSRAASCNGVMPSCKFPRFTSAPCCIK